MNIIFLTLAEINSVEDRGIYPDLLRKFRDEGHDITVVTPVPRSLGIQTNLTVKEGVSILQVKTLNIQQTNVIEKGLGTLAMEYQYLAAIKKYLAEISFDLVLYSTPPITLVKVVDFIKKRDGAFSYLLLKDIFPQNAVDMGMILKDKLFHHLFRKKEQKLYAVSDAIGCMSPANVDFLLNHNSSIDPGRVEVNPNSIEPVWKAYSAQQKKEVRLKYGLPADKKIFIYGGNLGVPQGLNFLLETILTVKNPTAFFLIVGQGTEYERIVDWFSIHNPKNAKLIGKLPKDDYDVLLSACDIGMIFLDKNFTIPNFPSRLLPYLEVGLPVISATDANTDIGDIIEKNGCGYKVLAGNIKGMVSTVDKILQEDLAPYSARCRTLLENEYHVDISYKIIMERLQGNKQLSQSDATEVEIPLRKIVF